MKTLLKRRHLVEVLLITCLLWFPGDALTEGASPVKAEGKTESQHLIHAAAQAVDEAWEEFHAAAIGGTLASPAVQTKIETQLHEARALLMEARKAERRGDHQSVKIMTDQLFELSNEIVQASREKKK